MLKYLATLHYYIAATFVSATEVATLHYSAATFVSATEVGSLTVECTYHHAISWRQIWRVLQERKINLPVSYVPSLRTNSSLELVQS